MKIMCKQEYYNQVVQYAESIKDTSLQNCMERLEAVSYTHLTLPKILRV